MSLKISSGDVLVDYFTLDVYWGRCGRVCCCRSLLWTVLKGMAVYVCTGDVVVHNSRV